MSSRHSLQTVLILLALFVVGTGIFDVINGAAGLPGHPEVSTTVDSNYRFFAGIWITLGIVMMRCVPHVERTGAALRAVCGAVFLGGLARLISYADAGAPHRLFTAFIVVEFVVPAVLIAWQSRLVASGPEKGVTPSSAPRVEQRTR
ncbi:DUF4345 domain-containing protein [Streptomyces sp. 8N706]|uniref:DUF4345 domain-containing protein n=1 Tax=Streptomyces sp. 8N706 TaxID=3457416 RepID=UPI003FD416E3